MKNWWVANWWVAVGVVGALVVPSAASAQTLIIDNTDSAPSFVLTGNDWTTWGSLGFGFDSGDSDYHYLSHTVGGSDRRGTATWTPDLPTAGVWEISTWWRKTENRTDDADHYVTDGAGGSTHIVLNQQGDGASGWVVLGQFTCTAGLGGCSVELDGTDDDQSDAANAVKFELVSASVPGDDDDDDDVVDPCESQEPGVYIQEAWAGSVSGSDWTTTGAAQGAPDGAESQTPNVDAGEYLRGAGYLLCDPDGDETITGVELEVLARTQYASGPYALNLSLHGGGASSVSFTGTTAQWRTVDVTSDLGTWTWAAAQALQATVELDSQPGGNRDSDAWVDAFRLRVTYEVPEPPPSDDDDATDPPVDDDDSTEPPTDDDDSTEADDDDDSTEADDDDSAEPTPAPDPAELDSDSSSAVPPSSGCAQTLDSGASLALLGLLVATGLRVRRRR